MLWHKIKILVPQEHGPHFKWPKPNVAGDPVSAQTRAGSSGASRFFWACGRQACSFLGSGLWPLLDSGLFSFSWVPGASGLSGALMLLTSTHSECSRHRLLLRGQRARPSWATRGSRFVFSLGGGGRREFYSGTAVPRVCSEWTRLTQVRMDRSVRIEGSVFRPLLPPKKQTSLGDQALLPFLLALWDHFTCGE